MDDNRLSEAEVKTLNRFMRTELGEKVLANIQEFKQGYLDKAVAGYIKGKDFTHDCIVAAAGIETIYQYLKPPKGSDPDE